MTATYIGDTIKQRRKQLGINQLDLAMVANTGRRFISDLENGKESCELGKTLAVLENLGLELRIAPKTGRG